MCCPGTRVVRPGAPRPASSWPRSGTSKNSARRSLTPPAAARAPAPPPRARARLPRPLGAPSLRPAASPLRCRPQRPSAAPWSSAASLHGLVRPAAAEAAPRALRWHLWPWGGLRQVRRVEAAEGGRGCAVQRLTPRAAGRGLIWLPCGGLFETAPRRTFAEGGTGRRPSGGTVLWLWLDNPSRFLGRPHCDIPTPRTGLPWKLSHRQPTARGPVFTRLAPQKLCRMTPCAPRCPERLPRTAARL